MNLVELNDKMLHNSERRVWKAEPITQDVLDEFRRLVNASKGVKEFYDSVEDSAVFMQVYPSFKKIYGATKASELFYVSKLGYYYQGVPAKLLYSLMKLLRECGKTHINDTLSRGVSLLAPWVGYAFVVDGEEITLKELIESICNTPIKLLTSAVPKVKSADCYEVWVPNVERVALIPGDIANMLPFAECEKIEFKKELGLVIGDTVVRSFNNRLGITKDDFDLRECI